MGNAKQATGRWPESGSHHMLTRESPVGRGSALTRTTSFWQLPWTVAVSVQGSERERVPASAVVVFLFQLNDPGIAAEGFWSRKRSYTGELEWYMR